MDNTIKREFALKQSTKILCLIGLIIFLVTSVIVCTKLYSNIKTIVRNQAVSSITNISQLNEDSVSLSIINRYKLVEMIAENLSNHNMKDVDSILKELKNFLGYYDFYGMGIMDESRTVYFTNGSVVDMSGKNQYETAWDDEFHLSSSYMPSDGNAYALNMFSYPIYYNGELKYILVASYPSGKLTERMNINSMGGNGFTFILNSMGDVAIYPEQYNDQEYNSLMKYINTTPEIIPNESGDSYFEYNGERYYAHFEPLEINQWYLMTCARESYVFATANMIIHGVFISMGILWLMVIIAIIITIYSIYRSKKNIRSAVFYDELLGIGNGNFLSVFFDKLTPDEISKLTLLIFDIDKFKEFNYIYGEVCGDNLLKYIVRVFHEELPGEYLFRNLSDNFVALIHCRNRHEFVERISKVTERFTNDIDNGVIQPFDISGGVRRLHIGDSPRRAISDALIAKGTVKGIHLQQYAFYDESILHRRMIYMEMESDFSRALRDNEFKVYYQPKYDITNGRIIGAEALVRWVKPDGSIVSPGTFIPCFEASRQIIFLDEAMLESVCRQMNEMERDGLPVQKVSVNLSRVHLRHHGILSKIERIVRSSGVDSGKLSFEITESALYEDCIPLKNIVDFLHNLGCSVDMDDYGVGVSGPNALAENQFDMVKLDKSFIDGIGNERIEAVIKSTIKLCDTLGMDILAEGVEEKYQAESLAEWGRTIAQGFYYSPPVPEEEYRKLLSAHA